MKWNLELWDLSLLINDSPTHYIWLLNRWNMNNQIIQKYENQCIKIMTE